jgi:hypothetical protein
MGVGDVDTVLPSLYYYSVTVVNPQADIDLESHPVVAEWFETEAANSGAWMVSTERGSIAEHLNFQCLAATRIVAAQTVSNKLGKHLKDLGLAYKVASRALSGRDLHTPIGMLGYCLKYDGNRDFHTLYATCITDEDLQRAKHAYLVHGNILKSLGRCTLWDCFGKPLVIRSTPRTPGSLARRATSSTLHHVVRPQRVQGRSPPLKLALLGVAAFR